MRKSCLERLLLTACLLIAAPSTATAQRAIEPVWVEPEAHRLAASPAVAQNAEALLDLTLSGSAAPAIIRAIQRIRRDPSLRPPERDAVLAGYLDRLREYAPGSAPAIVLDWLAEAAPLAVTGHEEGRHHPVALFNVAGKARGLANEWAWRRGHAAVSGRDALSPAALADMLATSDPETPAYRGMRHAIERLPGERLDALALSCASSPTGCGPSRPDIELARGNLDWLEHWLATAEGQDALPRLRRARLHLSPARANTLVGAALEHRDAAVAAWAISDLTAHLPKESGARRQWGHKLVDLLDDPELGSAAAMQLSRMDDRDWREAAASRPMSELTRRRVELIAELQTGSDREVER